MEAGAVEIDCNSQDPLFSENLGNATENQLLHRSDDRKRAPFHVRMKLRD